MTFVLDCSVTMAWFMPDEHTGDLLDRVAEDGAVVPILWPLEVGNAFLSAVRRRRISPEHRSRALDKLGDLPIQIDRETLMHGWKTTLALAERFRLTLYDACYLELAHRRRLPLASLDDDLRAAGEALEVPLLGR